MRKLVQPEYLAFPFRIGLSARTRARINSESRPREGRAASGASPESEDIDASGADGVELSGLGAHVREQIEQVLFTDPRERIFRPEFGAGVRQLVFEPNSSGVRKLAQQRLVASLRDALLGEVDPKTLDVEVEGQEETLTLLISYRLAAIDRLERQAFVLDGSRLALATGGPGG